MKHFENRTDAGQQLANRLTDYKARLNTIILALPNGGVPVAYEIARTLHLPMNIFLVQKLGIPGQREITMGAIAEKDICILNKKVIRQWRITEKQIEEVINQESKKLNRRIQHYRQGNSFPDLKQKTIILVDDGIATGSTIKAAITALKNLKPEKIIVAIPAASEECLTELAPLVDELICPLSPKKIYNIGQWYYSFPKTTDEEVLHLLANVRSAIKDPLIIYT